MAHYARKYRIEDIPAAEKRCYEQMCPLFETTETDYYFTEYAPGQFQRIRTYNPSIHISRHSETGETTRSDSVVNPASSSLAEFIATHRLILSDSGHNDTHYSDLIVLDIPNDRQKDEFLRVMQKNRPLDSIVIKDRAAFWHNIDSHAILVHLDKAVADGEHGSVGSFIEFEIKLVPKQHLSLETAERIFAHLEGQFDGILVADEPRHYRDILRETFGDYGTLVKTLPSETLKTFKTLPEIHFAKGELILKDFDQDNTDGFFILDGSVDVRYSSGQFIRTIGKHDFFGEMALDTGIRNANVMANQPVKAKHIPTDFLRKITDDITVAKHFMKRLRQDEITKTLHRRGSGGREKMPDIRP